MNDDIKEGDWLTPKAEKPQPDIDIVMPEKDHYYEVVLCSEHSYIVRNPSPDNPHSCTWIDKDNAIKYEPKFLLGETLICTNLNHDILPVSTSTEDWVRWTTESGFKVGKKFVISDIDDGFVELKGLDYRFPTSYFKPVYSDKLTEEISTIDYSPLVSINNSPQPIIQPTKEDSTMPNITNIAMEVSTAPYATKKVNTFYGVDVSTMKEEDLYAVLTRIKNDREALVSLDTGEASKRILAKIALLDEARKKVVAFIDKLEDA